MNYNLINSLKKHNPIGLVGARKGTIPFNYNYTNDK
jgi:hypothetical protein